VQLFSTRVKVLSAVVVVVAGLGVAALSGAFAAPLHGTEQAAAAPPAATATPTSGAKPERPFGAPGFSLITAQFANLAGFLGMSTADLKTAMRNGQTLAQIAQAHGKSTNDLKTFLTNQLKSQLDQQVASGKITSQRATEVLNAATAHLDQWINMSFRPGSGNRPHRFPFFGLGPATLQIVAQTLGMNVADVRTGLQSGKTLAQIAQEHGKTSADLENALLNADKARIEKLLNTNFQQLHQQRSGQATPTPTSGA
jgi:hypothetical protein